MEPGLFCRYKWSDLTYMHSEALMRFPIAGDPMYSGPAWTWGLGMSTVWYETDTVAFIPTLEFVNIWIIDGQVTPSGPRSPSMCAATASSISGPASAWSGTPAATWASSNSAATAIWPSAPTAGTTRWCASIMRFRV